MIFLVGIAECPLQSWFVSMRGTGSIVLKYVDSSSWFMLKSPKFYHEFVIGGGKVL